MRPSHLRLSGNNNKGTRRYRQKDRNVMSRLLLNGNNGTNRRQRRDHRAMGRPLNGVVLLNSARANRLMARRSLRLLSTKNLRLKNNGASSTKIAANKGMGSSQGDSQRIRLEDRYGNE